MRVRIDVLNGDGGVSVRIDGGGREEARRLPGNAARMRLGSPRPDPRPEATPAMVEAGIKALLAQGDVDRLGRAMVEVYAAMEEARRSRPRSEQE